MDERNKVLAVILAAYVFDSSDDDERKNIRRKKRKYWRRDWNEKREKEGFFVKLCQEFRDADSTSYHNFLRMTSAQFEHLLSLVSPHIMKHDTVMRKSISASERLILTLRFLATGDSFHSLQYIFRIPPTTISKIIPEVLDVIYRVLVREYLKTPTTPEAWQAVATKFNELWQFPNCIGALDGKHVVTVAPPKADSIFYNYKGTHSIILMGIADAEYKLLYVDVGRDGRFSDGGVFNRSHFGQAMETNRLGLPQPSALPGQELAVPYVLVADDAFASRANILKPYSQRVITMVQRVFNYRLSRARRIIENVFGIMLARFRVLRSPILLAAENTKKVTLACCVLHNYLMTTNKRKYAPLDTFDRFDENGGLIEGNWRIEINDPNFSTFPLEVDAHPDVAESAEDVRAEFAEYFIEEGEQQWQYNNL